MENFPESREIFLTSPMIREKEKPGISPWFPNFTKG
jgi:hypothetical protein